MTLEQLGVLAAAIAADAAFDGVPHDSDGSEVVKTALNLVASPAFWAWRTAVTKREIVGAVSVDGTTFTWAGNGFITRANGELLAWQELFSINGEVNPSLANVRQAFTDIFSGAGNAAANRTHLATVARRLVSRFERLFTTGTGSTASPGVLVLEGPLTVSDINQVWGL